MNFISYLIIGALAGFLAGRIRRGSGYGCIVNCLLGIVGGQFGGWLLRIFNLPEPGGFWASLFTAVLGAVLMLWIADKFRSK
ncbi:MAG: GlsB/YeaQ/YmgE family stress response membrane protein [Alloprevotella sp.]|nr:GlsB/YeaQ/YmgE family stress response membrane protein [Alloprevotella sp.]MBR1713310.1 GlsB/YeaQ/YmgE family stress response membrane protein [Alloprevotella sp.]